MWTIILSVLTAFFLGAVYIAGNLAKTPRYDRPVVYNSVLIEFIVNLSSLIGMVLLVVMFFVSWKVALSLLIGSAIFNVLLKGLYEMVIIMPIVMWAEKAARKAGYYDEQEEV